MSFRRQWLGLLMALWHFEFPRFIFRGTGRRLAPDARSLAPSSRGRIFNGCSLRTVSASSFISIMAGRSNYASNKYALPRPVVMAGSNSATSLGSIDASWRVKVLGEYSSSIFCTRSATCCVYIICVVYVIISEMWVHRCWGVCWIVEGRL